jgi:hypothetical protein
VWTIHVTNGCGGRLLVDDENPGGHAGTPAADAAMSTGGAGEGSGSSGASAESGGKAGASDAATTLGAGGTSGVVRRDAGMDARAGDSATDGAGVLGAGGVNDAGSASGGAPNLDGGARCVFDADCPPPVDNCTVSRCVAGRCETTNAPSGATVPNVPGDCHASVCDGNGNATSVVLDQTNPPIPESPCLAGTCNLAGKTGTVPVAAGTACSVPPGSVMCDGAGTCVECVHTADCASGKFCSVDHTCGTEPCTDTDCGGACPACDLGKHCLVDADCISYACDADTLTCIQNQCVDHRQDGNETASDCGGGICDGCNLGQHCVLDADCKSDACDVATFACVSNQCLDHRIDGNESDVDCGGGVCNGCLVGKKCTASRDCLPGHLCSSTVPHVCQ